MMIYGLICKNSASYEAEDLVTTRDLMKEEIKEGKALFFVVYQKTFNSFKCLAYGRPKKIDYVDNNKEKYLKQMLKEASLYEKKQRNLDLIKLLLD